MSEEKKNENLDQEVDYKAEYEKLIATQEREKSINGFRQAVGDRGLALNEEIFSELCNECDNKTLEGFSTIIKSIEEKPVKLSGIAPANPERELFSTESTSKTTFSDYLNNEEDI